MVRIDLQTFIAAPVERCFDLSRSVDLHMASTDWTGEKAIAGVTSGLIGPAQQVTWRGRHFGFVLTHTSVISAFERPRYFQDRLVRGVFSAFCHDHYFGAQNGGTMMTDIMEFTAPLGWLGRRVDRVLERHMRSLLERRNCCIKRVAESEQWRQYVSE